MLEFVIIFSILSAIRILQTESIVSGLCMLFFFDLLLLSQQGWLIIPLLISLGQFSKGQGKNTRMDDYWFTKHR